MKRKTSKITAVILAVMMVFAMTPALAFAATQDEPVIPVKVDFGSTHKSVAENVLAAIKMNHSDELEDLKPSLSGSVLTINVDSTMDIESLWSQVSGYMTEAGYGETIGDEQWSEFLTLNPQSHYHSIIDVWDEIDTELGPVTKDKTYYLHWFKLIDVNEDIKVLPLVCGSVVTNVIENDDMVQDPLPVVTVPKYGDINEWYIRWAELRGNQYDLPVISEGTTNITGGESYGIVANVALRYGYCFSENSNITINGEPTYSTVRVSEIMTNTAFVQAVHAWDKGVVNEDGTATYTCTACGETKTEVPQKAPNGTPCGEGASFIAADAAITGMTSDKDPAGSAITPLKLKSTKQGKTSVTLNWSKPKGATSFVIYGNLCGKTKKIKQIAETDSTSYVKKSLKKGKYYKYVVVALNASNEVVATSKMIHVATQGGKVTNYKSATMKVKKGKKYVKVTKATVKKGKSLTLKVSATKASKKLKVEKHAGTRWQSSDPTVATVSSKGVVKGIASGKCDITGYTQNGVNKTIVVTVK